MKRNRALFTHLIIAIGFLAFMTGCEDIQPGEACDLDDDCNIAGQICHEGTCTDSCQEDGDCIEEGDICVDRPDPEAEEGVCIPGGDDDCTDDTDCAGDLICEGGQCVDPGGECTDHSDCPGDEICENGTCILPGADYNTVLIEDRTWDTNASRCNDVTSDRPTAGAKIQWVALWDGGTLVEYATLHDYEFGDGSDWGFPPSLFDGSDPDYGGICPGDDNEQSPFNEDDMFALGCEGWLTVRFADPAGGFRRIEDHHEIEVGEYGPHCNDQAQQGDEYFDVSVCSSDIGSAPIFMEDINDHCDLPLNSSPLTGHNFVHVTF